MGGLLTSIGDEETNEQEPEPAQEAEMMIAVSVAAMTADDVLGCCEQLQVLASFTHSFLFSFLHAIITQSSLHHYFIITYFNSLPLVMQ